MLNKAKRLKNMIEYYLENIHLTLNSGVLPSLSIIVPFYNEKIEYLDECLRSIKFQYYKNIEVIVVDDGSKEENSKNALNLINTKYPNFKYHRHQENKGLASTRNTGAKLSTGVLITFLDSDDFLLPFSLVRRIHELVNSDNKKMICGVFGQIVPFFKNSNKYITLLRCFTFNSTGRISFLTTKGDCPFPAHAPILKKEIFNKFQGFDENLRNGAEDWEFWARLLRYGYSFVSGNCICGAYRQKELSMVRTMSEKHLEVARKLIDLAFEKSKINHQDQTIIYTEGLGFYYKNLAIASRAIAFLTMEYLNSGKCSKVWDFIEFENINIIEDNIPVDNIIKKSISRFQCLSLRAINKDPNTYNKIEEIRKNIF